MQSVIGDEHVMKGGLSHTQCSQYNKKFFDYILDDLMPWHREPELRDFSLLMNRYTLLLFCCNAFDVYLQRYWMY